MQNVYVAFVRCDDNERQGRDGYETGRKPKRAVNMQRICWVTPMIWLGINKSARHPELHRADIEVFTAPRVHTGLICQGAEFYT